MNALVSLETLALGDSEPDSAESFIPAISITTGLLLPARATLFKRLPTTRSPLSDCFRSAIDSGALGAEVDSAGGFTEVLEEPECSDGP
ncbi:Uncharacterised protein [Chlamydia trachomatis]|nr:Uncharacterised protein [Chlamydia trachomatis]